MSRLIFMLLKINIWSLKVPMNITYINNYKKNSAIIIFYCMSINEYAHIGSQQYVIYTINKMFNFQFGIIWIQLCRFANELIKKQFMNEICWQKWWIIHCTTCLEHMCHILMKIVSDFRTSSHAFIPRQRYR